MEKNKSYNLEEKALNSELISGNTTCIQLILCLLKKCGVDYVLQVIVFSVQLPIFMRCLMIALKAAIVKLQNNLETNTDKFQVNIINERISELNQLKDLLEIMVRRLRMKEKRSK
jgi:hypothetical protein